MNRIIGLLLTATAAFATVKPGMSDLVAGSTWVITARVLEVQGAGEEHRMLSIEMIDVIKGTFPAYEGPPQVRVERYGKGDIDFTRLVDQPPSIFFLKRGASGGLELTDAWFGVEPLTDATRAEVEAAVRGSSPGDP